MASLETGGCSHSTRHSVHRHHTGSVEKRRRASTVVPLRSVSNEAAIRGYLEASVPNRASRLHGGQLYGLSPFCVWLKMIAVPACPHEHTKTAFFALPGDTCAVKPEATSSKHSARSGKSLASVALVLGRCPTQALHLNGRSPFCTTLRTSRSSSIWHCWHSNHARFVLPRVSERAGRPDRDSSRQAASLG